jgi:pimeloyl-ACP methyl ester carboxylesterase
MLAFLLTLTALAAGYLAGTSDTVPTPPLDAHGHLTRTGDVTTRYERWGDRGTPVVLVHGMAETADVWQSLGPLLARDHVVFAYDLKGFGYTGRDGNYDLDAQVRQLDALLDAVAPGAHPLLVGHSMGAAVIAEEARRHPRRAAGVVFLDGDGTPYGVGPGFTRSLLPGPLVTAAIHLAARYPALARAVYESNCGPTCPPFDPAVWLTPLRVDGGAESLAAVVRQPLIGLGYAELDQIRTPAALVYGAQDPVMSQDVVAATKVHLRPRVVVAIPGERHLVMLSAPWQLAVVLERTITTLSGAGPGANA